MKKRQKALLVALSILLWIGLWALIAYRLNKPVLLPYPKEVAKALWELITGRDLITGNRFLRIVWGSFAHVTGGFLVAFVLGVFLSFLSTLHEYVSILLLPLLKLIKTVPVVSFIIILLFFVAPSGIGFVISMLMVLPVVYENVRKGILSTDRKLVEASKVFRFPFWKRLAYMSIPSVVPYASAACSTGLSLCWKAGIAAELIAQSPYSIGHEIYYAKLYVNAKNVFAWTIVIIGISVIFEKLFLFLFRLITVTFSAPTLWHHGSNLLRFLLNLPLKKEPLHENNEEQSDIMETLVYANREVPSEAVDTPAQSIPVCKISGADKYYDGKTVLSDVNLTIYPGSVTIVTGPSGGGKTTLLRMLLGLTAPDCGTCTFRPNVKLSAVFQENRLCEQLSAVQNVRMLPKGISDAEVRQMLGRVGIEDVAGKPVSEFSGGMKRRVAWVRALSVSADLMVLDEPFTGLDDEKKDTLLKLLKGMHADAGIVIVTHIASEIEQIIEHFPDAKVLELNGKQAKTEYNSEKDSL